jgi:hypothetical protein
MRLSLSKILTVVLLTVVTVTIAKLSDVAFAHLSWRLGTVQCAYDYFGVECLLADPAESTLLLVADVAGGVLLPQVPRGRQQFELCPVCHVPVRLADRVHILRPGVRASRIQHVEGLYQHGQHVQLYPDIHLCGDAHDQEVQPVFLHDLGDRFVYRQGLGVLCAWPLLPVIPGATGMFAMFVTYSFAAFGCT